MINIFDKNEMWDNEDSINELIHGEHDNSVHADIIRSKGIETPFKDANGDIIHVGDVLIRKEGITVVLKTNSGKYVIYSGASYLTQSIASESIINN